MIRIPHWVLGSMMTAVFFGSAFAQPEELITLNFKGAEVASVLDVLARKGGVNIVVGPEVAGTISIQLENVTWEQALDAITRITGFAYEKEDNIVLVSTMDGLLARHEAEQALSRTEPVVTRVIELKYLDASDVQRFLEPQLSAQGRISVLVMTGQKGWQFGTAAGGGSSEQERARRDRENGRSKSIVMTDTPSTIERLEKVLADIDSMPKQILIRAQVMEVNNDLLRDLGVEFGTGSSSTGVSTRTGTQQSLDKISGQNDRSSFGGSALNQALNPSIFVPETSGLNAVNTGLDLVFRKLRGTQFEVLIRALEEDMDTNTLSAPHILTLSGQEARILIGEKFPILNTQVSGTTSTVTTTTLDYYQDIGIELFVVPQVAGKNHIDMIIHPVVSSRTSTVGTNQYPILDVREAETQVLVENGETIVIGGLLKDVTSRSRVGLPFLGKLPLLGVLFSRQTRDAEKVNLLIFITAHRVEPDGLTSEEALALQDRYQGFLKEKYAQRPPKEDAKR